MKQKTEKTLSEQLKELKAENAALKKDNEQLLQALSHVVKVWRDSDAESASICYDACRIATNIVLGTSTTKNNPKPTSKKRKQND
jgi:hypothetical protein